MRNGDDGTAPAAFVSSTGAVPGSLGSAGAAFGEGLAAGLGVAEVLAAGVGVAEGLAAGVGVADGLAAGVGVPAAAPAAGVFRSSHSWRASKSFSQVCSSAAFVLSAAALLFFSLAIGSSAFTRHFMYSWLATSSPVSYSVSEPLSQPSLTVLALSAV